MAHSRRDALPHGLRNTYAQGATLESVTAAMGTAKMVDGLEDASPASLTMRWVSELLQGHIPDESNATCSDCAMCSQSKHPATVNTRDFRPDVKCCTYVPHLPNFAVGAILADQSPAATLGRRSVEQRIDARIGVTPIGIDAPPIFDVLYASSRDSAFGVSRALLCPHYVNEGGGLCGIWKYRNAICSTYYCKFVRGAIGKAFWERLNQFLTAVESALEMWCLTAVGIEDNVLGGLTPATLRRARPGARLTSNSLDGIPDLNVYERTWGATWVNRERDFYLASARLVEPLRCADVLEICGAQVQLYASLTRVAYKRLLAYEIPPYLKPGKYSATAAQPGFIALQSYSPDDQIVVPRAILDALLLFDGRRSTLDVITQGRDGGLPLNEWLVRRLVDFEVLVPCRSP